MQSAQNVALAKRLAAVRTAEGAARAAEETSKKRLAALKAKEADIHKKLNDSKRTSEDHCMKLQTYAEQTTIVERRLLRLQAEEKLAQLRVQSSAPCAHLQENSAERLSCV